MCKVRDAAAAMLNKSIDLAAKEDNPAYYMDFIKLHKLLFLAQCFILGKYNMPLFEETIYARKCGPYVDGIGFIPGKRGFGKITEKIVADQDEIPFLPISYTREQAIDYILKKYGTLNTDEVVAITKKTSAYQEYVDRYEQALPITECQMAKTGLILFE